MFEGLSLSLLDGLSVIMSGVIDRAELVRGVYRKTIISLDGVMA